MKMQQEYLKYQDMLGVGNPTYESWEWKTISGSHYSYIGHNRKVYQFHPSGLEVIMNDVKEMWFPESKGYRPFFVALTHSGNKCFFRSNSVTEFCSSDWTRERSDEGDLQTWYVLCEGKTRPDKWSSKKVVMGS